MFAPLMNQTRPLTKNRIAIRDRSALAMGDDSAEWISEEVVEAMKNDDVNGSGVFGTGKNVNTREGVFAASYSLPGPVARETGLGPSEIVDTQTGEPIEVFLTGLWNAHPITGQIEHRWPLYQGTEVPNHALTANRIDLQRPIAEQSIYNDPDRGAERPVMPNARMRAGLAVPPAIPRTSDVGYGPQSPHMVVPPSVAAGVPRKNMALLTGQPQKTWTIPAGAHPGAAGYGWYPRAVGDLSTSALGDSNTWTWAIAGILAGAALGAIWVYAGK